MVTYDPKDGSNKVQDVHSKKLINKAKLDDIIKLEKGNTKYAGASSLPERFKKYIPGPKRRLEIIQHGISQEKPIFADGLLGDLAYKLKPTDGIYDVVIHGTFDHLEYFGENIDVETFCAIIAQREDYKKGTTIRLISCGTGATEDGVADYVSKKLKCDVIAPTEKAFIHYNYFTKSTYLTVGKEENLNNGKFVKFKWKGK